MATWKSLRVAAFSISPQIAGSFAVRLPEAEGASAAIAALAVVALVRRRLG